MMRDLELLIDNFKREHAACIEGTYIQPAREAEYRPIPLELAPAIKGSLSRSGIDRLFSHQEESFHTVLKGNNTVIVTPTASGKTLCYNLPVIHQLLKDPDKKALYLFPTKALSHDQTEELNSLLKGIGGNEDLRVYTYDGDTPSSLRPSIRTKGRIIITNPDMLHSGILPNHPKWIKIFENLQYVVIDEIHMYKGIFGSHMANLIERLKRVAAHYGSSPRFICCSATIANPGELAGKLLNEKVKVIDHNGAPRGVKEYFFYNPPLVDSEQGIRRGTVLESTRLAEKFIRNGRQVIIFARSRLNVELITSYLRKKIPEMKDAIFGYRGGYLPNERRRIEKGIKEKKILGVISTNALELGIDIGSLDISILAGYPGSISSFFQQAGRSGRKNRLSAVIFIAGNSPLNQFLVTKWEHFFQTTPESGLINPGNIYIFLDHIKCSAFELPFTRNTLFRDENILETLKYLEEKGVIKQTGEEFYWTEDSYPAESISLRSTNTGNFVIINITRSKKEIIGEVDRGAVLTTLYPEAIYIHMGRTFQVKNLDWNGQKAYVEESKADYYTDAVTKTDLRILDHLQNKKSGASDHRLLEVMVRTQAAKYKKLKYLTHENIGYGDINLPVEEMHTSCCAFTLQEKIFSSVSTTEKQSILKCIAHLLRNISPLILFCDTKDLGTAEQLKPEKINSPTVFIYDQYPGGIGLSEKLYRSLDQVITDSIQRIRSCSCSSGCPSCIGLAGSGKSNIKKLCLSILLSI